MSNFVSDLNDFIDYDKVYELNIGKSFQKGASTSHHQFKCNLIEAVPFFTCNSIFFCLFSS